MSSITREAILAWLRAYAEVIAEQKDFLTQLDMAIGDGDHGANMHRGMQAVLSKLNDVAQQDIGSIFRTVAMTLLSTVGGASGPLYGTFFLQMASVAAGKTELTPTEFSEALKRGIDGIVARGKAAPGEKTMIDALLPAFEALKSSLDAGVSFAEAVRASAAAAAAGRDATIPMVAKKGRASYLGERSAGHQDPGATSSHLLLETAARTLPGTS
ncbi:MAG: dihydroxyacetone kinase subunit DhaL [Thermoflexales bacterium]|nr:dihydroxyacetone kinase subunit DhaL [Thermoflexales bacterium]MCS7324661.1 dihydroxyacetone kinase subunit DhaL [Thermoflexales bacterium]MCX7938593.1 dihydroxyacetone kinase subunit DhaL [Thermoflexales bacterium]MDW8053172.1 dihydroxyacetone kinase subunit DhaL [Anaerolineae bacterium]MDW8291824.1 dihydroxyacetone kinase subunit DhaL [Anaerolineae bacterium]